MLVLEATPQSSILTSHTRSATSARMAASTGNPDILLNLLHIEKETLWTQLAHLPIEERQRRWALRATQLNSALSTTPPVPRFGFEGSKEQSLQHEAIPSDTLPLTARRRSVPFSPSSRRYSRTDFGLGSTHVPAA